MRRNIATGGEDDGWWIREEDHLAALAEKDRWPRCDNDIGDGTLCNAELVDGGEGVGLFCPLCDLRDTMQEQREQLAALTAENADLKAKLEQKP